MQSKILSKQILSIVFFAGCAFFAALIFSFISGNSIKNSTALLIGNAAVFPEQEQASSGLLASPIGGPVRLKIPGIDIDAVVEYVGFTPDGAMDAPKSQDSVAWFELGPRPGENGSAVMAGHYGWKNGKGSVFDDLYKLREGDKLYVEDDKGLIVSFTVRKSRRYDPGADASEVFDSNDGKSHLNLITCEGSWDKASKTYSERLVVFADKD
ncbi:MAG: class F sortase [bacterium]|nr:class F sortase [bacterium]